MRESVNLKSAAWIANELSFKEFFEKSNSKVQKDAKTKYNETISYCVLMLNNDGEILAKYGFANNRKDGRRYGKKNIQGVMRYVRGMLLEGITTDIDIVNCHPTILLNLCQEQNIECAYLKQYINEREGCLEQIMELDGLNREDAKKKVLVSTNMGKKIYTKSNFLKHYDKEMKMVQIKLQEVEEYKYITEYAKKDNFNGSFVNHLLCVKENRILESMEEFCNMEADLEVHSLAFDGLQVYGTHYDNSDLLKDMEQFIVRKGLYPVKLTYKQHPYGWDIPEDYVAHQTQYGLMKEEFEEHHCKVGVNFVRERNQNDVFEVFKKGDFCILNEEKTFAKNGKEVSFMEVWFADADKRRYETFDTFVKDCPADVYNLWKPFKASLHQYTDKVTITNRSFTKTFTSIEEKCEAGFTWFCNHTLNIMCSNHQASHNLLMNWVAQMLQYPETKSIEIIIVSKEGAGKDLWLLFIRNIMGHKKVWECNDPINQVFGKFNGMMRDAFLVIFAESNKSYFFNSTDKKKQLITNSTITIKIENLPAFDMKSFHRFMEFSNNPDLSVLPRRTQVFKGDDCMCVDDKVDSPEQIKAKTAYFEEGHCYADDPDVCKYIYERFMEMSCPKAITRDMIVNNTFHKELTEASKPYYVQFLEDLIYENFIKKQATYTNQQLLQQFKSFCGSNHYQESFSSQKLNQHLRHYLTFNGELQGIKFVMLWSEGRSHRGLMFDFVKLSQRLNLEIVSKGECFANLDYDSDDRC